MTDVLHVLIDGQVAGAITERTHGRSAVLEYTDEYRARSIGTPISLSMPVQIRRHTDTVDPWLWNLLPENDRVIQRWATDYQRSAQSAVSLLSSPVGRDCAGAVQFATDEDVDELLERKGSIRPIDADEFAQIVLGLRSDEASWLGAGEGRGQFSLAGAQAKTALLRTADGGWARAEGAQPTTHIIKPGATIASDGTQLPSQALNEHLCMDAAARAELLVASTEIELVEGVPVIIIERYDRLEVDGALVRVHQEDMCQVLGAPSDRKYQNRGGPSASDIGNAIRRNFHPARATEAVLQFVDALAYNWLIGGTDAHAKNYSVLLLGRDVRLAPLYDIASALPYFNPRDRSVKLAMSLGSDYRVWPWTNNWPKVASDLRLDEGLVVDRVRALAERVPDAFADSAARPEISSLGLELPVQLVDAVAAQVARCRAVLG